MGRSLLHFLFILLCPLQGKFHAGYTLRREIPRKLPFPSQVGGWGAGISCLNDENGRKFQQTINRKETSKQKPVAGQAGMILFIVLSLKDVPHT